MIMPITFSPSGPEGFVDTGDTLLPTATLIEGEPIGRDHVYYKYESGKLQAGIWRSAPYTEWYDSYPCDEFMYVIEGHVYIEIETDSVCYGPGSAFLVPRGFRGYWRQPVEMIKYYVIVDCD